MKRPVLLLLLLFKLARSFGQAPDTAKKVENIDTLAKHGALFLMDGVALQKPYHFSLDSVIDITIITRDKGNEIFHSSAQNDIVVMISRHQAIIAYQKKFSKFSENYRKYKAAKHGDYGISYTLLNTKGEIKQVQNEDDRIKMLYKIPESEIKSVGFSEQETCCGVNRFCIIEVQ